MRFAVGIGLRGPRRRNRLDKPGGPVYHNLCPKTQKERR